MTMTTTIELDVYVSPYKPVVSVLPDWDTTRQATFPASSVSLLIGEKEAVLIDALMQPHGERGNLYTLWTAAYGVAQQLGGAK